MSVTAKLMKDGEVYQMFSETKDDGGLLDLIDVLSSLQEKQNKFLDPKFDPTQVHTLYSQPLEEEENDEIIPDPKNPVQSEEILPNQDQP